MPLYEILWFLVIFFGRVGLELAYLGGAQWVIREIYPKFLQLESIMVIKLVKNFSCLQS